jgi:hypothetical protein
MVQLYLNGKPRQEIIREYDCTYPLKYLKRESITVSVTNNAFYKKELRRAAELVDLPFKYVA